MIMHTHSSIFEPCLNIHAHNEYTHSSSNFEIPFEYTCLFSKYCLNIHAYNEYTHSSIFEHCLNIHAHIEYTHNNSNIFKPCLNIHALWIYMHNNEYTHSYEKWKSNYMLAAWIRIACLSKNALYEFTYEWILLRLYIKPRLNIQA